jgi:hypothetical protein
MATTIPQQTRGRLPADLPTLDLSEVRRRMLGRAVSLLAAGEVLFLVSGLFHPDHAHANDHHEAFAEYAASKHWTLVHIGQFAGMTLVLAGIITLAVAVARTGEHSEWTKRYATTAAVVSIVLYGVLQAVDGVALKQAVDAWAGAPVNERAVAFRTAEAIRWIEWGVRAFQQIAHGTCLLLLAALILSTQPLPRFIAVLAGLAGISLVVQGYVLSHEGFSMRGDRAGLLALIFNLGWIVAVTVVAGRRHRSGRPVCRR